MSGRTAVRSPALEVVGENIIVARARCGLSQVELAERSGISRVTISKIENGADDVGFRTLETIATALGCAITDLLDGVDDDVEESDAELERRRATTSHSRFVDADAVLTAADEAAGRARYSNAGRRRLAR